jgi:hypothetical protein
VGIFWFFFGKILVKFCDNFFARNFQIFPDFFLPKFFVRNFRIFSLGFFARFSQIFSLGFFQNFPQIFVEKKLWPIQLPTPASTAPTSPASFATPLSRPESATKK